MNEVDIAPRTRRLWPWLPAAIATRLYIVMLGMTRVAAFEVAMRPRDIASAQMDRAERLMQLLRKPVDGALSGADMQAMKAYQTGVAVAFYGLVGGSFRGLAAPVSGSVWSRAQLLRLRSLGLHHGAIVRHLSLAATRSSHVS